MCGGAPRTLIATTNTLLHVRCCMQQNYNTPVYTIYDSKMAALVRALSQAKSKWRQIVGDFGHSLHGEEFAPGCVALYGTTNF